MEGSISTSKFKMNSRVNKSNHMLKWWGINPFNITTEAYKGLSLCLIVQLVHLKSEESRNKAKLPKLILRRWLKSKILGQIYSKKTLILGQIYNPKTIIQALRNL